MKTSKVILAITLVLALSLSLSIYAFAAEEDILGTLDDDEYWTQFSEEEPATVQDAGDSSDLVDSIAEYEPQAFGTATSNVSETVSTRGISASTELFTMNIGTVYDLLTTYYSAGKSFTAADLTYGGLRVSGTLTQSAGYTSKVGAASYDQSSDTFVPATANYFNSGLYAIVFNSVSNFSNSVIYYGYVKNHVGTGYITGGPLLFANATN